MTFRAIHRSTLAIAAAAATAVILGTPNVSAQNVKESFTGFAINMNSGPRTAVVDFTVERWSTDTERESLLEIITAERDPTDKLLRALQRMPKVGYIRTPDSLAWDLRYARESPLEDGGRRIVLATDRPIGFWEARNQPRTIDYPFTIVEIRLNKEDKGEGKILAGTKIYVDKKTKQIVLENYGQQPVRFNEIHKLK
jgi:hypothetical protein